MTGRSLQVLDQSDYTQALFRKEALRHVHDLPTCLSIRNITVEDISMLTFVSATDFSSSPVSQISIGYIAKGWEADTSLGGIDEHAKEEQPDMMTQLRASRLSS